MMKSKKGIFQVRKIGKRLRVATPGRLKGAKWTKKEKEEEEVDKTTPGR